MGLWNNCGFPHLLLSSKTYFVFWNVSPFRQRLLCFDANSDPFKCASVCVCVFVSLAGVVISPVYLDNKENKMTSGKDAPVLKISSHTHRLPVRWNASLVVSVRLHGFSWKRVDKTYFSFLNPRRMDRQLAAGLTKRSSRTRLHAVFRGNALHQFLGFDWVS